LRNSCTNNFKRREVGRRLRSRGQSHRNRRTALARDEQLSSGYFAFAW
jgi:hypothetical protein